MHVRDLSDSADPNAENCVNVTLYKRCNIRSAWLACSDITPSTCVISLPFQREIEFNTTKGYLTLLEESKIILMGNYSIVTAISHSKSSFISLYSTDESKYSSLKIANLAVHGFGGPTIDGGMMSIIGGCALEMINVNISNSSGHLGGALYISSTSANMINITDCTVTYSTAVNGGAIYLNSNVNNFFMSNSKIMRGDATSNGYVSSLYFLSYY